jgi:hypothetical protein
VVGIWIKCSIFSQKIGTKNSRIMPKKFDIRIIKKRRVMYIFKDVFSASPSISSKK